MERKTFSRAVFYHTHRVFCAVGARPPRLATTTTATTAVTAATAITGWSDYVMPPVTIAYPEVHVWVLQRRLDDPPGEGHEVPADERGAVEELDLA